MKYIIVGDIHGCFQEFKTLLTEVGCFWDSEKEIFNAPNGYQLVCVGDITDRGPDSASTYLLVSRMVASKDLLLVRGNHCDKLMRYAKGNKVIISHGLKSTINQFNDMDLSWDGVRCFFESIPYYLTLDDGKLIIAHAAFKESLLEVSPFGNKCRTWCLYGPNKGMGEDSFPIRIDWVGQREASDSSPTIVFGHQPYRSVRIENKTYGIDTGCVFGGYLTALKYPEMELISVKSLDTYYDGTRWGDSGKENSRKK